MAVALTIENVIVMVEFITYRLSGLVGRMDTFVIDGWSMTAVNSCV